MPKIPKGSKVWVGSTFYFIAFFLLLGLVAFAGGNALGQHQGTSPHFLHFSSNLPTNLASTTDPQSARRAGTVLSEGAKMADVTIYVSNQAELYDALKDATGGETILLAEGNYNDLTLGDYTNYPCDFASEVTIRSADPQAPATFSSMMLRGVTNLSFDAVIFDYSFRAGDPSWVSPFKVLNCSDISISNSIFDGDVAADTGTAADGFGYGKGLVVEGSSRIDIVENEFFGWLRGAFFDRSSGILVADNNLHDIRSDGLDFVEVTSVLIESNYIHDFITSPTSDDHADFIQFWTSTTTQPSSDITIRSNVLDIGDGGITQGIFMKNEAVQLEGAGPSMYYKNILITENVILGAQLNSIAVGETDGLTIENNSVLSIEGASIVPAIRLSSSSTNVSVAHNATSDISGYVGQPDWSLLGNAYIQNSDPMAPGYYGDQFIESSFFQPSGVAGYLVAPGSMLDQLGAGATMLSLASRSESVLAAFDVGSATDGSGDLVLDGRYSTGVAGEELPEGTTYVWKLESGALFEGPILTHQFAEAGFHHVELHVTLPDGATSIASAEIAVAGNDLLSYDYTSGLFVGYGYGTSATLAGSGSGSIAVGTGSHAIDLGATGTQVSIARQHIERIFGAESLSISFSLKADTLGTTGELFRLHSTFLAEVTSTGELKFNLTNADGVTYSLLTTGAHLNNGLQHEIAVRLDDSTNTLGITIDGMLLAQKTVTGTIPSMGYWDLTFGNPWGSKNFDGRIGAFDIDAIRADYPTFFGSLDEAATHIDGVETSTTNSTQSADLSEVASVDTTPTLNDGADSLTVLTTQLADGVDDGSTLILPEPNGFNLDLVQLGDGHQGNLIGDAHVVNLFGKLALSLDGSRDAVRLGSIPEVDSSSKITLDIAFTRNDAFGKHESLVQNSSKLSVILNGDSLEVYAGNGSSSKSVLPFIVDDVGLADDELHSLRIVADSDIDRIQFVLDGQIIFDQSDVDIDFQKIGSQKNWWSDGWSIGQGSRRDNDFDGFVTEFQIDDSALFIAV